MARGGRGVDFITIDGARVAPGAFRWSSRIMWRCPSRVGFSRVQKIFHAAGVSDRVVFIDRASWASRGCAAVCARRRSINVGREALLSIGCIQAQRRHTQSLPDGHRHPTSPGWCGRRSAAESRTARQLRADASQELLALSRVRRAASGTGDGSRPELLDGRYGSKTVAELFGLEPGTGFRQTWMTAIRQLMDDLRKPA